MTSVTEENGRGQSSVFHAPVSQCRTPSWFQCALLAWQPSADFAGLNAEQIKGVSKPGAGQRKIRQSRQTSSFVDDCAPARRPCGEGISGCSLKDGLGRRVAILGDMRRKKHRPTVAFMKALVHAGHCKIACICVGPLAAHCEKASDVRTDVAKLI